VEFAGEPAIDAGGLKREWLELAVSALFEPKMGLFESTLSTDESGYCINPSSADYHADHLMYFHFTGRLLGKALMEQQLINAHLALPLLKHILGVPITFSDLEFVDGQLHKNLLWLSGANAAEVEAMSIDFTVSHFGNGKMNAVELCPGGKDREVTQENKAEYIRLVLRYRMLDSVAPQLFQLLNGLFQVVPRELLTVFDYQELEMVLCGLPVIDVSDWQKYTK
jgi:E3 ubiquitin ligase SMURF1/2